MPRPANVPPAAAGSLRRLLSRIDRRARAFVFLRASVTVLAALAPVAALASLLATLFLPMLAGRSESYGFAPAAAAIGVTVAAAFAAGSYAARRPPVGTWTRDADRALGLEGRLDAGSSILRLGSSSRLAALALADADARAAEARARDAVVRPRLARAAAIACAALVLAILASLLPPVKAAAPPAIEEASAPHVPHVPPATAKQPSAPPKPSDASPLSEPPTPTPQPKSEPEPKPEPPPPVPQPQSPPPPKPEPEREPDPLMPPPPQPEVKLDPKFLEPLVGPGLLHEKDAFTPTPDSGTRPAKPLTPEELKRVFPEIRKRAEASLPRQPFDENERKIVAEYLKWMPR